jgi:hypothetical protein
MIKEITLQKLNPSEFINEKVNEIKNIVGNGTAVNALSGGVDSSVVTMLGHKALGNNLKTVFIDNGIIRDGLPALKGSIMFSNSLALIRRRLTGTGLLNPLFNFARIVSGKQARLLVFLRCFLIVYPFRGPHYRLVS